MSKLDAWYKAAAPHLLSLMRIVFALLFIEHGTQKLFGFPPMPAFHIAPGFHLMSMPPQMAVAGGLETVGGILLLIGLLVRPVALILSGEMAVAYFTAHAPNGLFPIVNKGELAVLYCFAFLYLAIAGGGAWSLDNLFRRGECAKMSKHTESIA